VGRLRSRVQQEDGRARLDRDDVAQALRRPRASALERYVVLEEMLAAGAPVSAHWIADRQSGPLLLRFGTEAQRQKFLPAIARGELSFAIGMSEPDSGSDLASLRTRAERVPGGYRVNGTKVWTSNAHLADYMIATFRTSHDPAKKHEGLSQFLVDTKLPGITMSRSSISPGSHHFNMVVFDGRLRARGHAGRRGRARAGSR
jgi:acyl-CoA dehydrogenase